MIKEIKEYDYGLVSAETESTKWEKDFVLYCDTKEQIPYAEKCLEYLDNLSSDMESRLAKYIFRYYKDYEQYYSKEELEEWGLINESTIFDHVEISSIAVDKECRTDRIEFDAGGNCDWEPEHGLEITISDGRILYVGPFEGYGPNSSNLRYALENYGYYDPEGDPSMNYIDEEETIGFL